MRAAPLLVAAALVVYVPLFLYSLSFDHLHEDGVLINDVSRLHPTRVSAIESHREVEGLQQAIADARADDLHVSIAGKRHSMGGHAFYTDVVESGATWKDVIDALNSLGLSVEVMQAYNGFTGGGSLSVHRSRTSCPSLRAAAPTSSTFPETK